ALRQLRLEALRRGEDALAHIEDVVAVLLVRGHEYGALPVEAADVNVLLRVPAHLGDVAHPHAAAVRHRDYRVAHFIERLVAAGSLETERAAADVDRAAGDVRVLALQRLHHAAGRELQLRHQRQVECDAQLAGRIGPGFRRAHAVERLERIAQIARVVLELAIRRIGRHQRELHDVHQAGVGLLDLDLGQLGRQRRAQRVDLAHDLVVLLLGVDRRVELGDDDGHAVVAVRLDLLDVVQLAQAIFDRFRDQALDVLRLGTGVGDHDLIDRDRKVRVFLARNAAQRRDAERDQQGERDDRELVAPDRKFEQPHCRPPRWLLPRTSARGSAIATCSPSSRYCAPSVMTCSPASTPLAIATLSPSMNATSTSRRRARSLSSTNNRAVRPSPSTMAPIGTYTREPALADAGTTVSLATKPLFSGSSVGSIVTSMRNMPLAASAALATSVTLPLRVSPGSASKCICAMSPSRTCMISR